ncbi:unnamed protein product [Tuber melanosporum]|uniref:(Perigord truffle) hypothetical protein n=1 Tax=Tuber melanosporum (strain Mel28) TaxID=656061 RepID=D5GGH2_TUBMM|nr:uncharacterized protein GSTUM_00007383001 [Tuber melanosporum]CAZ83615.1 unnamed protein product [Tuber melanosporum]
MGHVYIPNLGRIYPPLLHTRRHPKQNVKSSPSLLSFFPFNLPFPTSRENEKNDRASHSYH